MDELELLKKDWQKKGEELPKLSYNEIHNMLWKKSSSLVKWILIISILEFTLPNLLYLIPSVRENLNIYDSMGIGVRNSIIGLTIIQYTVIFYFIYQFYKRYKEISVLDNSKNLMEKILRTRKTVKHYVLFCLSLLFFTFIIIVFSIYLTEDITTMFPLPKNSDITPEKMKTILMWGFGIFGILFTAFMGGIYFLLYGILLRKLNKNYKELQQLEV